MNDNDDFEKALKASFGDMNRIFDEMDSMLRHFAFGGFSIMDCKLS